MALPSFIFGGNTGVSYDQLQDRRKQADILAARLMGIQPKNTKEGIGAILQGIGIGLDRNSANSALSAGQDSAKSRFEQDILSKITGMPPTAAPDTTLVKPERPSASAVAMPKVNADGSMPVTSSTTGNDPLAYFGAIRAAESGGNDSARNPRSSATGRYQFIDSTWSALAKKHPELGLTPEGRLDPEQNERAIRAFTADNAEALGGAGIAPTPGNLYASHFLGSGGARSVLSGDDSAPVSNYVSSGVVRANPFLQGMTVADFKRWSSKKAGGGTEPLAFAPREVASLDPSFGMSAADAIEAVAPQQPSGGPYRDPMVSAPNYQPVAAGPALPAAPSQQTASNLPALPTQNVGPAPRVAVPSAQAPALRSVPKSPYSGIDPTALIRAASDPYLPEEMRNTAKYILQQQQQASQQAQEEQTWRARQDYLDERKRSDPNYQVEMELNKARLDATRNKAGHRNVVNAGNGQLYDQDTGEWISAPAKPPTSGNAFRFAGTAVDAQALNGLIESGRLTVDQAQDLAAGKQVTGPNGETIFMTPQSIFGQQGKPAQSQGVDIFAGSPDETVPPTSKPAPQVPSATPIPQQGSITMTGPKAPNEGQANAAGFADRMAQAEADLAKTGDVASSWSGVVGNIVSDNDYIPDAFESSLMSGDYQAYDQARRNFINAQMRRESGAVIGKDEFANANKQYFPMPGDTPEVLQQKKVARADAIAAMQRSAGPTYRPPAGTPDALKAARDAIAKGAPRDKVVERLRQNGIDPSGL